MKFQHHLPTFSTREVNQIVADIREQAIEDGQNMAEIEEIEVQFGCDLHRPEGLFCFYDNSAVIIFCRECGKCCGQFEVADRARHTEMEYSN